MPLRAGSGCGLRAAVTGRGPQPLTLAGGRAEGRPLTEALGGAPLAGGQVGDHRSDPRRVHAGAAQHEGRLPDLSFEGRESR